MCVCFLDAPGNVPEESRIQLAGGGRTKAVQPGKYFKKVFRLLSPPKKPSKTVLVSLANAVCNLTIAKNHRHFPLVTWQPAKIMWQTPKVSDKRRLQC